MSVVYGEIGTMEARFLAGIIQTDTYQRLQVAEEILEFFKDEEHVPQEFPELDRMIGGLGAWMSSSNSKVAVVISMKGNHPHLLIG